MSDLGATSPGATAPAQGLRPGPSRSPLKRPWYEVTSATALDSPALGPRRAKEPFEYPRQIPLKFQDPPAPPSPPPFHQGDSPCSTRSSSLSRSATEGHMLLCVEGSQLPRVSSTWSPHADVALQRLDSLSPSSPSLWRSLPRASGISSPHPFSPHAASPSVHSPSSPCFAHRLSAGHPASPGSPSPRVSLWPNPLLFRCTSKLGRQAATSPAGADPLSPDWAASEEVPCAAAPDRGFHRSGSSKPEEAGQQALGDLGSRSPSASTGCAELNQQNAGTWDTTACVDCMDAESDERESMEEGEEDLDQYSFRIELGAAVFAHSPDLNASRAKVLGSRHGTPLRRKSADLSQCS